MSEDIRNAVNSLHYQLKAYYDDGKLEYLIPGRFLKPGDLYYTLDQFVDLEVYNLIADIIEKLKLPLHDRLVVAKAVMSMECDDDKDEKADWHAIDWRFPERLEIIDVTTGEVIDFVEN